MSKYQETFTIREASQIIGCSYVTLWRRCVKDNLIPYIRVKGKQKDMLRILKSDLARILDTRNIKGGGV